jgi:hypothetical protein
MKKKKLFAFNAGMREIATVEWIIGVSLVLAAGVTLKVHGITVGDYNDNSTEAAADQYCGDNEGACQERISDVNEVSEVAAAKQACEARGPNCVFGADWGGPWTDTPGGTSENMLCDKTVYVTCHTGSANDDVGSGDPDGLMLVKLGCMGIPGTADREYSYECYDPNFEQTGDPFDPSTLNCDSCADSGTGNHGKDPWYTSVEPLAPIGDPGTCHEEGSPG